ncbi:MAG: aminoacyl-tRNA hydrolase [Patescibacteria group bacterium UBA2163]
MFTIVGLGNPGSEYTYTRHNAGRSAVQELAEAHDIALKEHKKPNLLVGTGDIYGERTRLIVPDTFMNKSGAAVSKYVKSVNAAKKLIVVHDEIDLPLGIVRVSFGSRSAGHNGVKSIERAIKTKEFIKIRIGVAKPGKKKGSIIAKKPTGDQDTVDYLLGKFTKTEREKLGGPIQDRVLLSIQTILETRDPIQGMNAVNGLPPL